MKIKDREDTFKGVFHNIDAPKRNYYTEQRSHKEIDAPKDLWGGAYSRSTTTSTWDSIWGSSGTINYTDIRPYGGTISYHTTQPHYTVSLTTGTVAATNYWDSYALPTIKVTGGNMATFEPIYEIGNYKPIAYTYTTIDDEEYDQDKPIPKRKGGYKEMINKYGRRKGAKRLV